MKRLAPTALVLAAFISAPLYAVPAPPTAAPTPSGVPHGSSAATDRAPVAFIQPNPPAVDAKAYILVDAASGEVLAQRDAEERLPPASLTKLMTCYVLFNALKAGTLKLTDSVTISEHAWRAEGSRTFVQVGSQVPAEVLIKGMIVQSGNDATIALAERVGGTESAFVQLMNSYAQRLGMNNTHFDNSTGLPSPTHYTTAHDLSLLARALVRDFPNYYSWFSIREFVWNNIHQDNRNGLLGRDPSVDGMKTGHTDGAGYCLVTSAKRDNMRLIAVVLDSPSIKAREEASAELINYGYTNYQVINVERAGTTILKPRVYKAVDDYYGVGPNADVSIVIPRAQASSIETNASVKRPLLAPLSTNVAVGELQIVVGGKPMKSVPLYPLANVPEGGFWSRLSDSMRLWYSRRQ
jgi:D-alanyl-D-alanine carboxypeptidase (penicillin-binding protein 5/6)